MKPNLEEALRSLRLADRDITVFDVLKSAPDVHLSMVCFHAQQAVEKSLKAVLYRYVIEFERIHDLVKLAKLLRGRGIVPPIPDDDLRKLNPFAVTFRYDDKEIERLSKEEAARIVTTIRHWAGEQIEKSSSTEEE